MPPASASVPNGRSSHVGVLALTVLVFGVVIAAVTVRSLEGLRRQIVRQQGETIAALVSMQLDNHAKGLEAVPKLPPLTVMIAAIDTFKWPGVAAVRVFDAERNFLGKEPFTWGDADQSPVPPEDWILVANGDSIARIHSGMTDATLRVALEELGVTAANAPGQRWLEAWVPLRRSSTREFQGAAQFWIRDETVLRMANIAEHDFRLWSQAAFAWVAGSAVILLGLSWAFRRVERVNAELRARSEDLQRANRELVLAAKTSALGTVTAHLMHELKNPIAGLESIMAGQGESAGRPDMGAGGELAAASELTRRLRTMVNDVVSVLRDEQTGAAFELTAEDVVEVAMGKVTAEATRRNVKVVGTGSATVALPARRANLAILVLRNLLQNALEASAPATEVRVLGRGTQAGDMEFTVEDSAAGLPADVRDRLFQPCSSSKAGGSGLGLALSYQLAQQAGGKLELVRSTPDGTCFRLVLRAEA